MSAKTLELIAVGVTPKPKAKPVHSERSEIPKRVVGLIRPSPSTNNASSPRPRLRALLVISREGLSPLHRSPDQE